MATHLLSIAQVCRVTLVWLLLSLLVIPASTAHALETTLVISTPLDIVDGDTTSADALRLVPGTDDAISLREAIIAANNTVGNDTLRIVFDIDDTDPSYDPTTQTWRLMIDTDALPPLTRDDVILEGGTTPATTPAIILDGYDVYFPDGALVGLALTGARNIVRGFAIVNFYDAAMVISGAGATENQVEATWLGIDPLGPVALAGFSGIELRNGASNNTIGGALRNVIGGNVAYGVRIGGATTHSNIVAGNWIGVAPDGEASASNQIAGILLEQGTTANQIGRASRNNVISGNTIGIKIDAADSNTITGNIIGLRPDGNAALPNTDGGIFIVSGADSNTIGGTASGAGNVIAGNGASGTVYGQGLYLADSDTNRVLGNWFGTSNTGFSAYGNLSHGILVLGAANRNQIGGDATGEGNVIGFNGSSGIRIDVGAADNIVAGNFVGVAADGSTPIGNQQNGILLDGDSNIVGPGNRIMFNLRTGVLARGTTSTVRENEISANGRSGVCIVGAASQLVENILRDNGTEAEPLTTGCGRGSGVVISSTVQALVSENTIDHNTEYGIAVIGGRINRFVANSIRGNGAGGIALDAGANDAILAPEITSATNASASGRGCGSCRIEVFGDAADQGEIYLGSTLAAADGSFQLSFAGSSAPFLTATNTDQIGNTSPFGAAAQVSNPLLPTATPTRTIPTPPPATRDQVFLPALRTTR